MDDPNTRDDAPQWEPESEESWIFDLPKGAWERQELRNRDLRQRLLRNLEEQDDRGRSRRQQDAPERAASTPPPDEESFEEPDEGEQPAEEAPLVARRRGGRSAARWDDVFRSWSDDEPEGNALAPWSDDTPAPRRRLDPGAEAQEPPAALPDPPPAPSSLPLKPRTRGTHGWDEMFDPSNEPGSIVDAMREWVERSRARNSSTRAPQPASPSEAPPAEPDSPGGETLEQINEPVHPGSVRDEDPGFQAGSERIEEAWVSAENAPREAEPVEPTTPLDPPPGPTGERPSPRLGARWTLGPRDAAPRERVVPGEWSPSGARPDPSAWHSAGTPGGGDGPLGHVLGRDSSARPGPTPGDNARRQAVPDEDDAAGRGHWQPQGWAADESTAAHSSMDPPGIPDGTVTGDGWSEYGDDDNRAPSRPPTWAAAEADDGPGDPDDEFEAEPEPNRFVTEDGEEIEIPPGWAPVPTASRPAAPAEVPGGSWSDAGSEADTDDPVIGGPGWLTDWRAEEPPEESVLVRAFNAHAAEAAAREAAETIEEEPEDLEHESFVDLLGEGADELVAEVADPAPGRHRARAEDWGHSYAPRVEVPRDDGASIYRVPMVPARDDEALALAAAAAAPVRAKESRPMIRGLVETILLALLVFLAVRASFQNFRVEGTSMAPTLENGEFLLVNKLVYAEVDMGKLGKFVPFIDGEEGELQYVFHGPHRGDIVVLKDPRRPETDLIKRVIGLPGETVEIRNGRVFINDLLLDEPYITTPWNDSRAKLTVPEGQYYVLGDNRNNSLDSRSTQVGLIPKELIIGKALLSYWPVGSFGLAPNSPGTTGGPELTTTTISEFESAQPLASGAR